VYLVSKANKFDEELDE